VAALAGTQADDVAAAPRAELRRIHEVAAPPFLALIRAAFAAGRVNDTSMDATGQPSQTVTIGGMIAHGPASAAFVRGPVMLALRQAGIDYLGIGDPRGFVTQGGPPAGPG
jgi:hypothetical protein